MADNRGFVLQSTMNEVVSGLYIGSALAEGDSKGLNKERITHVLTVATHYKPSHPHEFTYKIISIDDLPQENIIQYFPECNAFINKALESGGRVLVHCMAGQSRSATVAAAYLMQKDKLTVDQAIETIKKKRPQIHPNSGFIEQLQLYYDMRYDVTTQSPLYRSFLVCHNAEHYREYGTMDTIIAGADPQLNPMPANRIVRCKKCRRPLVTESNIIDHRAGAGQMAFSYKKRNTGGVDTPHAFPQNRACSSLFVEPMEWMDGVSDGLVESKINCPKCSSKLGSYNWSGAQCSCGKWITPSFQIHRNRVDEVFRR